MKTTGRTLWVMGKNDPTARRLTNFDDGGFRTLPSRVVIDFDGDPADWEVATSDYVARVSADDVDGFRTVKGTCSAAKLREAKHTWKELCTLGEFIEKKHPLNEGGVTLETIQEFYAEFRKKADVA